MNEPDLDRIAQALDPGERVLAAGGAIAARRRRGRGAVPRRGFILVVTDHRLVAMAATTWRARPTGQEVASWHYDEGATLAGAAFGRVRLVLPDRSVVTLAPYGGWSLRHLVRATARR